MTTSTLEGDSTRASRAEFHKEGIWGEETTHEGLQQVVFRRPLPMQLITQYVECAVRHANLRQLEEGAWLAEVQGFQGVWSSEPSAKQALDALEEVIFEWVLLKIRDQDRDLPVLEGLDLNEF